MGFWRLPLVACQISGPRGRVWTFTIKMMVVKSSCGQGQRCRASKKIDVISLMMISYLRCSYLAYLLSGSCCFLIGGLFCSNLCVVNAYLSIDQYIPLIAGIFFEKSFVHARWDCVEEFKNNFRYWISTYVYLTEFY